MKKSNYAVWTMLLLLLTMTSFVTPRVALAMHYNLTVTSQGGMTNGTVATGEAAIGQLSASATGAPQAPDVPGAGYTFTWSVVEKLYRATANAAWTTTTVGDVSIPNPVSDGQAHQMTSISASFPTPGYYQIKVKASASWWFGSGEDRGTGESQAPYLTLLVTVVNIDKLQYRIGGQGVFADVPNPLVVPVGSSLDFQAVATPAGAGWPTGKPVWGGTSGVSGTGATKTVTFNAVSTSLTDYKTVPAECGNTVTADVIVCSMEMDRYNVDITSTQSIKVGEMMNLSAVIKPDGLAATYQWTIPGTVAHDWIHNDQNSFDWPLGDAQKAQPSLNFAWVDGGNGRQVGVSATVNGVSIPSVTATFDVTRPNYGLTITKTANVRFALYDTDGVFILQDGDTVSTNGVPGVTMLMTGVLAGDVANCNFWQIVTNSVRKKNTASGWMHTLNSGGEFTLDTSDPYGPDLAIARDGSGTSDSPGAGVIPTDSELSIQDSFSHFLMYKPPGADHTASIWVPLATASWSWAGHAIRHGTNWASSDLVSSTPPSNVTGTSTTSYPGGLGWTNNIYPPTWVNGQ